MLILKLAARNLLRNLRRSLVLILTVGFGVAALFMFDGFNAGIMNQYRTNTIHAKTGHGQLNSKGYLNTIYAKPWDHWLTDVPQIEAGLREIQGVSHVFPRVDFFAVVTNGEMSVAGKGTGVSGAEEADFFWTINIVEGEMLRDHPAGAIIGVGMARALGAKPGSRLTLLTNTIYGTMNGIDVTVVGIFHSGMKEADDSYFRVQLVDAQRLLDTDKVETIAVGLQDDLPWSQFVTAVNQRFPDLDVTGFATLDKVYYQHAVDWLGQQFYVIQSIIVLIITLGIFNTVSFTVAERTPEMGALRANGDTVWDVIKLLLCESLMMSAAGSVLGIVLSSLLNGTYLKHGILMPPAPGITRQFNVLIELQADMAGKASLLGLGSALLATLVASWLRARIPIAEALRSR